MAISWGSIDDHLRVGIDISQSPSTVGSGTSSVTLTVKYYVGTDSIGWDWNDTQTLTLTGALTGSYSYHNDLTGVDEYMLVVTRTLVVSTSYSGDVTRSFTAKVSGAYNGATPSKTRSWTVDQRPNPAPSAPSNPSATLANIGTTSLLTNWTAPSDWGGNNTGNYQLQYSTTDDFSSGNTSITVNGTTSYTITGLSPSTRYWVRVRANNGTYGPYSGVTVFSTAGAPFPPAGVTATVSGVTVQVVLQFTAEPYGMVMGNAPTSGEVQFSTDPGFTSPITFTGSTGSVTASGLTAGVTYYTRGRRTNSYGSSAWVTGNTVVAPAGPPAFIKVAGTWRGFTPWVKVSGTWRQVTRLWVKVGGTWR